MPIQIRVMSWNIEKKQTNARFIAGVMKAHQIDICALLEVPNSQAFTIAFRILTELNNLNNPTYHQGSWKFTSVDVGNEAVTYIWHETANAGPNAFQAEPSLNNPLIHLSGKVLKNAANNTIYFPTTKFSWAGLPGKPAGRRPAFMSFLTNDGQPARRFTILDLHTPFNVHTSIQSYSTHLYASSREITAVERVATYPVALSASATLAADLAASVDPVLTAIAGYATFVQPQDLRAATVKAALAAIEDTIDTEGNDLQLLVSGAVNEGINAAVKAVGAISGLINTSDARALARGCAMAGAVAGVSLVAAIQPPAAPVTATASAAAAAAAAAAAVLAAASQYKHPAIKAPARIRDSVRNEAKRMARVAVLQPFTFAALPQVAVQASIVAGDFNVDYPDTTVYTMAQLGKLGGGDAYTALGVARNTARTTRIGPSAYYGQRVYSLKNPCPIQSTNPAAANYVPLDMAPLIAAPTSYMGNAQWVQGLQQLAAAQHLAWAGLVATYGALLDAAFDMEVIDDTSFYRASCYDNIFVHGAANVLGSGMIDVMSELGSWGARAAPVVNPQPPLVPNPWVAAAGRLNPAAQAQLGQPNTNLAFTFNNVNYNITPALANAEEAAVFFDQFISDHLPVAVGVGI